MKSMWTTVALAALALSPTAWANDISINAGTVPLAPLAPYAHIFTHDASSFTDTVDFVLSTSVLSTSANALNVSLQNLNVFNIQDLSYTLWGGVSGSNVEFHGTFPGNNSSPSISSLMPGAYHLTITGIADGVGGGAYGLAMTSAVPEPGTITMLLLGLGLLGGVSRFKKSDPFV